MNEKTTKNVSFHYAINIIVVFYLFTECFGRIVCNRHFNCVILFLHFIDKWRMQFSGHIDCHCLNFFID